MWALCTVVMCAESLTCDNTELIILMRVSDLANVRIVGSELKWGKGAMQLDTNAAKFNFRLKVDLMRKEYRFWVFFIRMLSLIWYFCRK